MVANVLWLSLFGSIWLQCCDDGDGEFVNLSKKTGFVTVRQETVT